MYRINKLDMKIGKYEFISKAQADSKIESLGTVTDDEGNIFPDHNHSVVELGHIVLTPGVYDEEGNESEAPVLSEKYHVDVCWDLNDTIDADGNLISVDHPFGWKSYAVFPADNGVHSFYGLDFMNHTFE
jgi:hypothetical protein